MKLGKYRHYKGKEYNVVATAIHSETLEEMVVYDPLYELEDDLKHLPKDAMWVRPKKNFLEDVVIEEEKIPRFQYIG